MAGLCWVMAPSAAPFHPGRAHRAAARWGAALAGGPCAIFAHRDIRLVALDGEAEPDGTDHLVGLIRERLQLFAGHQAKSPAGRMGPCCAREASPIVGEPEEDGPSSREIGALTLPCATKLASEHRLGEGIEVGLLLRR